MATDGNKIQIGQICGYSVAICSGLARDDVCSMHPPRRGGFPARATAGRGGPSFVKNTNSCAPPGFPQRSIEELLQAPARRNQPTLHPKKRDGSLWISIDDEVKYDIKRAFSNDFDGAWWNLSESYWDSDHHNLVKALWTKQLRRMISNNISKGETNNKKPNFVSDNNWKLMWRHLNTPQALHVSNTNSKNRKSERDGDGIHQHISGSKSYAKVKYEMMIELGEEPAITDLVRKAHMKSDGTFVDKRAQRIIEEVESIVVSEHPSTDETDSQGSNSEASITPLMRDEAFYKVVKPHKGRLFGLGTAQMENYDHIAPPVVVLTRQAQLEKEVINLTGMVKLMSQQLTALCEARGVTVSDATTSPSPSSPPTTNEPRI
ncbi:PREDICTED: uncharacterized protein LOC106337994 [Brassica oleracea var. oleracea]|uniref:uncharacterized protein LOC106337994 n=1 Tax=Brassica oleracea var. oleracea TaxID=109376 RepID=UPI0006A6AD5E|nr:PREDICTED: uncharacterized protein LOC106337994 [Brassica oleracea var. oleracea]